MTRYPFEGIFDDITRAKLKQPDPPKPRATQEQLERTIARLSTAAGAVQPDLVTPLSKDELESGNSPGWSPAITSTECTPRPRYGESKAKFERRMASYGMSMAALRKEVNQRNRKAALRSQEAFASEAFPLGVAYWTQCACGFCGLKVGDPELARREYDAHPCAAEDVGNRAVERAVAELDKGTVTKRTTMLLQPSETLAEAEVNRSTATTTDETAQRMALLEGIPK